jgi:hypothetical protein
MRMPILNINERFLQLLILGSILILGSLSASAQTTNEDDNDEFINEIDRESFKSDFGNDQRDRSIDYSREDRRVRENNYDIFGNDKEQNYKFDEIQTEQKSGANSNGGSIMIQAPQGGKEVNPRENVNMPSVSDPFKQGQTGVKSPRNIDAVPDNGDEPNDVPLDGGITILGLAAAAYGFRKFKK